MPALTAMMDSEGRIKPTIIGSLKTKHGDQRSAKLFSSAGIPSAFEPEMAFWLRCENQLTAAAPSIAVAGKGSDLDRQTYQVDQSPRMNSFPHFGYPMVLRIHPRLLIGENGRTTVRAGHVQRSNELFRDRTCAGWVDARITGASSRNTAQRISRLKGVCVFILPSYEQTSCRSQTTGFLLLSRASRANPIPAKRNVES